MDPLDYMVEDCWLHLFQFLSAEDKQSLCQTSGSLQAMLEPQKTKWGLELILPFILKEFERDYYYYYDDRYKKAIKSALDLRHVCKAWKAGFDQYFGTHGTDLGIFLVDFIKRKYSFNFNNAVNPALQNFLTFFKAYDGNPFIGRRVSIYAVPSPPDEPENQEGNSEKEVGVKNEGNAASETVGIEEEDGNDEAKENGGEDVEASNADEGIEINGDEDWDDEEEDNFDEDEYLSDYERARRERELKYRELLMELLSKYGKEIEYLYLGRTYNCATFEAYKFLQIVFCNCLNLQSLEVQFSYFYEARESGFQKRLEEYFEMNPLPKMHGLRELQLCKMNAHLEKLMLEACGSNLQRLERHNSSEIPVSIWGTMKCLRHLTMSNCRFEQMETLLRAINSPLEVLILKRITFDDEKHIKIDNFLLAIQHLPLKNVEVYGGGTLKESEPFPDDFPKHKTISNFSVKVDVFSPNFLQFLPELQSFFVNGAKCLWRPLLSK